MLFLQLDNNKNRDEINIFTNVSWQEYLQVIENQNGSKARISYLNGEIKIVSPSLNHEIIKEFIGYLIEAYCEKKQPRFLSNGFFHFET